MPKHSTDWTGNNIKISNNWSSARINIPLAHVAVVVGEDDDDDGDDSAILEEFTK